MSVSDATVGTTKAAWLLDYRIDSSTLRPEHREWLDRTIVRPILAEDAGNAARGKMSSDGEHITVWVVGSASRTGSYDYNLRLSSRRAEAVRAYLAAALQAVSVVFFIRTHALSELRAAVMGDKDETENMAHRAVYVAVTRHPAAVPPQQPPITPPSPAIAVDFYFYAERAHWFNVSKWKGELYARFKHKGDMRYMGWFLSSSGLTVSPGDINKAWTPALPSTDVVFAGHAAASFPNPAILDRLSHKTIYPRVVGKTLTLRIVDGAPDRDDLILKMPVLHGDYQLSQGVGSLGKMAPLGQDAIDALKEAIHYTVVCGGSMCA